MPEISDSIPRKPRPRRYRRFVFSLLAGLIIGLLCWFVIAVRAAREVARHTNCRGRMAYLTMALQNYHDMYGSFPPAYIADAEGRPMHSWRVLILPYLDEDPIYRQYRFNEPWDGPHNRELAKRVQNAKWHCPSGPHHDDSPLTDYVLIVGPGTAFPGQNTTSLAGMQDGPANTILLAEVANSDIHWMEPRDLAVDRMSFQVNDPARPSISSPHRVGPAVVFADGITAYRLEPSLRPQTLKALTTIAGHENVTVKSLIVSDGPSPYYLGE